MISIEICRSPNIVKKWYLRVGNLEGSTNLNNISMREVLQEVKEEMQKEMQNNKKGGLQWFRF